MRTAAKASHTVPVDEVARAEAREVVRTAGDRTVTAVAVELDDGTAITLPPRLAEFVTDLLQRMSSGAGISMHALPDDMTTTVAADVIGISRPTLMKLIDRGEIAAHTVGTHHRLRRDDVLELRRVRREARSLAARELLEAGEAFD
ncbi:excisionase family DNA-binding protein [Curtobacterium sp. ZW137]|uniref:excisionase family DNA-binding protein n=1 Tax=Curtobacterium sp. ZW137 TaxID=2485104 RepID=UPI000F4BDFE5|nr:helix-turn-helix domain-containing protein [Curtobacterium sp. ZW137]ROP61115.1 excisionase family DNA binding protein [Curtobacterium sp. ZW137]